MSTVNCLEDAFKLNFYFMFRIGRSISFVSGQFIRINDITFSTLPSLPLRYGSLKIFKAGLFAVIKGDHFLVRWDFGRILNNQRKLY